MELVIRKRQWEWEGEAVGPRMSDDEGRCHVCISNFDGVEHKLRKNQMYRVKICLEYARSIRVKIILL